MAGLQHRASDGKIAGLLACGLPTLRPQLESTALASLTFTRSFRQGSGNKLLDSHRVPQQPSRSCSSPSFSSRRRWLQQASGLTSSSLRALGCSRPLLPFTQVVLTFLSLLGWWRQASGLTGGTVAASRLFSFVLFARVVARNFWTHKGTAAAFTLFNFVLFAVVVATSFWTQNGHGGSLHALQLRAFAAVAATNFRTHNGYGSSIHSLYFRVLCGGGSDKLLDSQGVRWQLPRSSRAGSSKRWSASNCWTHKGYSSSLRALQPRALRGGGGNKLLDSQRVRRQPSRSSTSCSSRRWWRQTSGLRKGTVAAFTLFNFVLFTAAVATNLCTLKGDGRSPHALQLRALRGGGGDKLLDSQRVRRQP